MKKRILTIALVILLMAGVSIGTWAIATSSYGTSSDPLITLSYLNDTLMPQILADFQTEMDEKVGELTAEFESQIRELEGRLSQYSGGDVFAALSLRAGQSVTCQEGTEIMLRSGAAEAWSELSDLTSGESLASSGALIKNHMYVVVSAGGGLGIKSDVVILIRGTYTVN